MSSKSHAIIQWDENKEKKFDIIKVDDIFLGDNDEDILIENEYSFKQKKNKGYSLRFCIVKFLGTKNGCEMNLKKICTYEQISPNKKSTQKTTSKSSISLTPLERQLVHKSSLKNNILVGHSSKDTPVDEPVIFSSTGSTVKRKTLKEIDSIDEYERKLNERDDLIKSLKETLSSKEKEIVELRGQVETHKKLIDPTLLKNIVPLSIQVLKFVGSESERDEVRNFGSTSKQVLIQPDYDGHYMNKTLYDNLNKWGKVRRQFLE
ncbi:unnamed protein product [Brachionus calyciflorus]|uniref:Uncharacterized protein n=1 Tax=Brachionus calyciflorus TaxID=104777 RepID=A0A814HGM2_9BILA|nr:unnamed protein product [Brachionus calyciflorus]